MVLELQPTGYDPVSPCQSGTPGIIISGFGKDSKESLTEPDLEPNTSAMSTL